MRHSQISISLRFIFLLIELRLAPVEGPFAKDSQQDALELWAEPLAPRLPGAHAVMNGYCAGRDLQPLIGDVIGAEYVRREDFKAVS